MNNFGVQLLLDNFLKLAPPPAARESETGIVEPTNPRVLRFYLQDSGQYEP